MSSVYTPSAKADAITTVLAALPEQEHDRLVPLMSEAPHLIARLIPGRRPPHKASMLRSATRGVQEVRLRTVCHGRTRLTCARWLAEFWYAVAEAKLSPKRGARRAKEGKA